MVRKREKEYSFEEAMHIARQAALPHWYLSEPLFVGATNENGGTYPQPLLETVSTGTWCIFYCSLTGWTFDRTLHTYLEWNRRFSILGIRFIFIFRERFPLLAGRLSTEDWLKRHHITGPVACDIDGMLNQAFGEESYPRLAILQNGEIAYNDCGQNWLKGGEKEIHRILRMDSPGLPFLMPWEETEKYPEEKGFIAITNSGVLATTHGIKLDGRWHVEADHIWTQDRTATLEMTTNYSDTGIVAQCMTEGSITTKMNVSSVSGNIPDSYAGSDAYIDGDGSLMALAHFARTYFMVEKLPASLRKLRFRFPMAHEAPVKIYGFEFAEAT
jgi:hypothetical protein